MLADNDDGGGTGALARTGTGSEPGNGGAEGLLLFAGELT